MRAEIDFRSEALLDLQHFKAFEQKIILDGIEEFLTRDAAVESRKRKQLRRNVLAPWELRIGDYRVFYDPGEETVEVLSIGIKRHNELFIRGRKVVI